MYNFQKFSFSAKILFETEQMLCAMSIIKFPPEVDLCDAGIYRRYTYLED